MHPYLGGWIPTLVLLHVLAAFAFALLHGPSIFAMWRLREERELAKVQALLSLSRSASELSWIGWSLLTLTGLALAAAQHAWREPWVWGSALVLIFVTGAMSPLAANAFNHAREAAGLPWFDGKGRRPARPVDPHALRIALDLIRARSLPILLLGTSGLAILVWLMVARPT